MRELRQVQLAVLRRGWLPLHLWLRRTSSSLWFCRGARAVLLWQRRRLILLGRNGRSCRKRFRHSLHVVYVFWLIRTVARRRSLLLGSRGLKRPRLVLVVLVECSLRPWMLLLLPFVLGRVDNMAYTRSWVRHVRVVDLANRA